MKKYQLNYVRYGPYILYLRSKIKVSLSQLIMGLSESSIKKDCENIKKK